MIKTRSSLLVAALVLGAGGSAHAQAACPASAADRITIQGVNLNDGANYEIFFGTTAAHGLTASVKRNAACIATPGRAVLKGGIDLGAALPSGNNNLCLGGTSANVNTITYMSNSLTVCGVALTAMNYAGNILSTFGGNAVDRTFGGTGRDIQNGNSGNDQLSSHAGNFDQLFGGTGNDTIGGGAGTFTWCMGNSGNDLIQDKVGNEDTLEGGTNDDMIDSGCNNAIITCDTGTDRIWHPAHSIFDSIPNPTNCETDTHTAGC
jgi:Ca2+-binding RTX toxin-like protein